MKLRKFFGLTSRSVLEQVRAELGADAVIVANHATPDGVEVTALAGDAIDTLLGTQRRRAVATPRPRPSPRGRRPDRQPAPPPATRTGSRKPRRPPLAVVEPTPMTRRSPGDDGRRAPMRRSRPSAARRARSRRASRPQLHGRGGGDARADRASASR